MEPILGDKLQESKINEMSEWAHQRFPQIGAHLFRGMFRVSIRTALADTSIQDWREEHRASRAERKAFFARVLEASRPLLRDEGLSDAEINELQGDLKMLNEKYWSTEDRICFSPIGIIHSPHKDLRGMPIQPASAVGITGQVELYPAFEDALEDIEGFSHIILLYYFHQPGEYKARVKPFLDDRTHGVLATRAPNRPNRIGLSVVKLTRREGPVLYVENVDVFDGTPLLDIKPYVPEFDHPEQVRIGWLERHHGEIPEIRSDDRFIE